MFCEDFKRDARDIDKIDIAKKFLHPSRTASKLSVQVHCSVWCVYNNSVTYHDKTGGHPKLWQEGPCIKWTTLDAMYAKSYQEEEIVRRRGGKDETLLLSSNKQDIAVHRLPFLTTDVKWSNRFRTLKGWYDQTDSGMGSGLFGPPS